ncbi:SDR family NAD(P)-dependent oxidoreductase [Pedobacter sp. MC2016-15]|uniref:SDR family NAD(P)-dependent oxidoreductase n=1 Tax=Pedobacter sp. MC2016-15 TaxID=2994473 RepID=UPI002245F23F|nr:SDR family NAD(P)-dependent oxidoreductase [Pedobacter sp. MC2016-15]MCX2478201.1 SDR family NAD(P)-dependent oxidoreductase [Pedobacter sp. MC2016-15]
MQSNEKKVALVTGANTGVGFQVAKALANNGYTVFVGSRDLQKGEAAVAEIDGDAKAIQINITDSTSINNAVKQIESEFGYLTLLVNNAAISNAGKPGRTMEEVLGAQRASIAPLEEMRTVWDTNVFGTLAVTQAFLPLLRKASAARIVTVSSALGSLAINANPDNPYRDNFDAVYGASKTALNGIFLSLAIELESTNIKVNLVSPGFTATALNNFQGTDTVEEGSLEPIRVALSEDIPTGSFTGPANFAGTDNILLW